MVDPAFGEQAAHAGTAKKSRKLLLLGVVAGVVVVALVGVAGWFPRGTGTNAGSSAAGMAPDFVKKPRLGEPVDVADVLDGDFTWVRVLDLVDSSHMLVYGATYDPLAIPSPRNGSLVLGLLNLDSQTVDWQVDLCRATGFKAVGFPYPLPMGDGSFVVRVQDRHSDAHKVVVISSTGKVTGTRDVSGMAGGTHGYVVLVQPGAPSTIGVAKASDIGNDLWRADVITEAVGLYPAASDDAGHLYVPTADGMVDGRTGKQLGYGAPSDNGRVQYFAEPDGTVFRRDGNKTWDHLTRVNPDDGTDMWDNAVDTFRNYAVTQDMVVVVDTDDTTVQGFRKTDGTKAWSTTVADTSMVAPLMSGTVAVVSADASVTIIDPKDGKKLTTLNDVHAPFGFDAPSGKKVFYITRDGHLKGYSATGSKSSALWTLDLDSIYTEMMAGWGRLFLVTLLYDDGSVTNNKGSHASVVEVLRD
ncbi:MAG: PQQ-binding-like beta-propeller repeat protein [Micrococcales bacterium]|nr:PQQ-binding-like beta-propeller repeat protein [Micrococcales bacterium]MCL2667433.1 PQQ-binding-like beta-propeller repeat protein [Micrococcales bacterium]